VGMCWSRERVDIEVAVDVFPWCDNAVLPIVNVVVRALRMGRR